MDTNYHNSKHGNVYFNSKTHFHENQLFYFRPFLLNNSQFLYLHSDNFKNKISIHFYKVFDYKHTILSIGKLPKLSIMLHRFIQMLAYSKQSFAYLQQPFSLTQQVSFSVFPTFHHTSTLLGSTAFFPKRKKRQGLSFIWSTTSPTKHQSLRFFLTIFPFNSINGDHLKVHPSSATV